MNFHISGILFFQSSKLRLAKQHRRVPRKIQRGAVFTLSLVRVMRPRIRVTSAGSQGRTALR
eukprot:11862740-Alexandrium_andersonii.AAC.1